MECAIFHRRIFRTGSNSAFTLVELMVVIAIIAIVAALLIPAIARARTNSRIESYRKGEVLEADVLADLRQQLQDEEVRKNAQEKFGAGLIENILKYPSLDKAPSSQTTSKAPQKPAEAISATGEHGGLPEPPKATERPSGASCATSGVPFRQRFRIDYRKDSFQTWSVLVRCSDGEELLRLKSREDVERMLTLLEEAYRQGQVEK